MLGVDFGIVLLYRAALEDQSSVLEVALIEFYYSKIYDYNRQQKIEAQYVMSHLNYDQGYIFIE